MFSNECSKAPIEVLTQISKVLEIMRPFFIGLSVALGFNINPMVLAQTANAEVQNMIQNLKLTKTDVRKMIDILLKAGKISEAQAKNAIERLSALSDNELKSLSMDAVSNYHNGSPLFADEKNTNPQENSQVTRSPASLPSSPFFQVEEELDDNERERKRREEVQKTLLKSAFDIKKFQ